jgi:regulator of sirC expression with transglutaminase-like and TPR domain
MMQAETMTTAFEKLTTLLKLPDEQIPLVEAALLIAQHLQPDTEPAVYLKRLAAMGQELAASVPKNASVEQKIAALNHYLYEDMGYIGNELDYYSPWNSFLSAVIDSKAGIPITLSILHMELGKAIGLDFKGVSYPGHFLVMLPDPKQRRVFNPFNNGDAVSDDELHEFLATAQGVDFASKVDLNNIVHPASHKDILARLLGNLKKIYFDEDEIELAIETINLSLLIHPDASHEYRDRGLLYQQLEAYRAALEDLSHYLDMDPQADDAKLVGQMVRELKDINDKLN